MTLNKKQFSLLTFMHPTAILYALSLIPGIGNKTLRDLVVRFGGAEAIWEVDEKSLLAIDGLGPITVAAIIAGRKSLQPDEEWKRVENQGIHPLAFTDEKYPRLLKEIPDAPMILFTRGNYDWADKPLIAIVGTRKFTSYGEQVGERLATDLARAGYVVVSGLAFGIDSIAHKAALEAGCETLAILGGGIDEASVSPQSHLPLARAVVNSRGLHCLKRIPRKMPRERRPRLKHRTSPQKKKKSSNYSRTNPSTLTRLLKRLDWKHRLQIP